MSPVLSFRPTVAAVVLALVFSLELGAQSPAPSDAAHHRSAGDAAALEKESAAHRGHGSGGRAAESDSAAVAEVIHGFHAALEAGDSTAALALLSDHATILESGASETKEEYRSHHLPGDIAFARAVQRESGPVRVVVRGDAAWATSASVMRGTYRDRPIHSQSVELMVLERTEAGWRIAAIHWSSRALRS
jgi:ketosteroid isomerase-like protein